MNVDKILVRGGRQHKKHAKIDINRTAKQMVLSAPKPYEKRACTTKKN